MSFEGFTEADIRKLSKKDDKVNQLKSSKKTVAFNLTKNKTIHPTTRNPTNSIKKPDEKIKSADESQAINGVSPLKKQEKPPPENDVVDKAPESVKKFEMGAFEAKQKLIEEQNRRRKELLSRALADRTRRTEAEARRLSEIRDEFKKLDALLSNDVKILRQEIEIASVEYATVEKRYQRAEKEYVEAKLALDQKRDKKALLTEHLCAIIEKNEERKAEKLNELLEKLQVGQLEIPDGGKGKHEIN